MATTYTENYNLGMQKDHSDKFDMDVITDNMEKIDEALAGKQDTLTPTQLNAINSGIDSTKVEQIETNKNNISTDEAALVELVDGGAKNLFNPSNYNVVSTVGVTPTPNSDGTYTLSGAASGSTADFLYTTSSTYTNMYGLKAGSTYTIVSGDNKVLIRVDASTNPSYQWNRVLVENVANKATFTIPNDIVGLFIRLRVPVASGNVDNVVVTPMICTKAAWDISHAYQPYRPSYAELVEANRRKVYANTENNTSYTFSNLYGLNESRFKYALVCGGGTANNPALAMAWFIFIDDSGVVTARKIIGDSTRSLTGSVSGTTLTLTTDATMYGGLRLIWLS